MLTEKECYCASMTCNMGTWVVHIHIDMGTFSYVGIFYKDVSETSKNKCSNENYSQEKMF